MPIHGSGIGGGGGSTTTIIGDLLGPSPNYFGATAIDGTQSAALSTILPAKSLSHAEGLRDAVSDLAWLPAYEAGNRHITLFYLDEPVTSYSSAQVNAAAVDSDGDYYLSSDGTILTLFIDAASVIGRRMAAYKASDVLYINGDESSLSADAGVDEVNNQISLALQSAISGGLTGAFTLHDAGNLLLVNQRNVGGVWVSEGTDITGIVSTKQDVLPTLSQDEIWTGDADQNVIVATRRENLDDYVYTFGHDSVDPAEKLDETEEYKISVTLPGALSQVVQQDGAKAAWLSVVIGFDSTVRSTFAVYLRYGGDASDQKLIGLKALPPGGLRGLYTITATPRQWTELEIVVRAWSRTTDIWRLVGTASLVRQPVAAAPDVSLGAQGERLAVGADGQIITEPKSAGEAAGGAVVVTDFYGWNLHADNDEPGDLHINGDDMWVTQLDTDDTATSLFVYSVNGALKARYSTPGQSSVYGVAVTADKVFTISVDSGGIKTYSLPDLGSADPTVPEVLSALTDFDIAIGSTYSNRRGLCIGHTGRLVAITWLSTRSRVIEYTIGASGLTYVTGFNVLNSSGVIPGIDYFDGDYFTITETGAASSVVISPRDNLMYGQAVLFPHVDAAGDAIKMRGIAYRDGALWSIVDVSGQDRSILAWDIDTSELLIAGEDRPASRSTRGSTFMAEDEDMDDGALDRRDAAVSPANLGYLLTERGFVGSDGLSTYVDDAHKAAWHSFQGGIRALNPPAPSAFDFYGENSLGRSSLQTLVAVGGTDDAFYIAGDRQVWTLNPLTMALATQIGGNTVLPGSVTKGVRSPSTNHLFLMGADRKLIELNLATNVASYIHTVNRVTGDKALFAHGNNVYTLGDDYVYQVDLSSGTSKKVHSISHDYFGEADDLEITGAFTYYGHVWILSGANNTWLRLTNDAGVLQATVQARVTIEAGNDASTALSFAFWRGAVYSSHFTTARRMARWR